jgi:hypothetical protein
MKLKKRLRPTRAVDQLLAGETAESDIRTQYFPNTKQNDNHYSEVGHVVVF